MRFSYDRRSIPPALNIPVAVSDLARRITREFRAKADTGAAMSAIPRSLTDELGLHVATRVSARGPFDRQARYVEAVYLNLRLPLDNAPWAIARVLVLDSPECLIGRDILNALVLHADGPSGEFSIE